MQAVSPVVLFGMMKLTSLATASVLVGNIRHLQSRHLFLCTYKLENTKKLFHHDCSTSHHEKGTEPNKCRKYLRFHFQVEIGGSLYEVVMKQLLSFPKRGCKLYFSVLICLCFYLSFCGAPNNHCPGWHQKTFRFRKKI